MVGDGLEPSDTVVRQKELPAGAALAANLSKAVSSNDATGNSSAVALLSTMSRALEHFAQSH